MLTHATHQTTFTTIYQSQFTKRITTQQIKLANAVNNREHYVTQLSAWMTKNLK